MSGLPGTSSNKSCLDTFLTHEWNPKNWEYTSKKVNYAAIVFLASLVTIAFAALIVTCPRASGALFTILSISAVVSLAILIIGIVKRCNKEPDASFTDRAKRIWREGIDVEASVQEGVSTVREAAKEAQKSVEHQLNL